MSRIPDDIRDAIREAFWVQADAIGWSSLNDSERAGTYERWTNDPELGGKLAYFMDPRKVRVYIKDSLIKPYERARLLSTQGSIFECLGLSLPANPKGIFIKPHGCVADDGRVVCWGKSRDWKLVLIAAFERAELNSEYSAFGVVLLETGKTSSDRSRNLVRDVASRLGIHKVVWLES